MSPERRRFESGSPAKIPVKTKDGKILRGEDARLFVLAQITILRGHVRQWDFKIGVLDKLIKRSPSKEAEALRHDWDTKRRATRWKLKTFGKIRAINGYVKPKEKRKERIPYYSIGAGHDKALLKLEGKYLGEQSARYLASDRRGRPWRRENAWQ